MLYHFSKRIKNLILFLLLQTLFLNNFITAQKNQNISSDKKGGICFRIDDNNDINYYLQYATIFNNYGYHFTFALNLGLDIDNSYLANITRLQSQGHELMDHTPNHITCYFYTKFSLSDYYDLPGVDHITKENKVCLEHQTVDIKKSTKSGLGNLNKNFLVSKNNGEFKSISSEELYVYFKYTNILTWIVEIKNKNSSDPDTLRLKDVWYEPINLGNYFNETFYIFNYQEIHLTTSAYKVLGRETIKLSEKYGLKKPTTWIQPGGNIPRARKSELLAALSDLGYTSGAVYPDASIKTYNEYDPNSDNKFGMQWGNFNNESSKLHWTKEAIADGIAKHKVLIDAGHFVNPLDGWQAYLDRLNSLLQWCSENNIPILTYSEWTDILYNQISDPNVNIIPPLNIDLDANNIPDGYSKSTLNSNVLLDKNDGFPESTDFSYSINHQGQICKIEGLGGIEKGENNFEIWTKGSANNIIEVTFTVGTNNYSYKFPAVSTNWKKYSLAESITNKSPLFIPNNISLIDISISCSDFSNGLVKISGMKLAKSIIETGYLFLDRDSISVASNASVQKFTINSNTNWQIINNSEWVRTSEISGKKNKEINVSIDENNSESVRKTTLQIKNENILTQLNIKQNPKLFLILNTYNSEIGNKKGSFKIFVNSNTNWQISKNADWLNLNKINGFGNDSILVEYDENKSIANRNCGLIFSFIGFETKFNVKQKGSDSKLVLSQSNFELNSFSGYVKLFVNSNSNWIIQDSCNWLDFEKSNGKGDDSIIINYSQNFLTKNRNIKIFIYQDNIKDSIIFLQLGEKPYLKVFPDHLTFENQTGIEKLYIQSNSDWSINDSCNWLAFDKLYGHSNDSIIITCSKNDLFENRYYTTTISYNNYIDTLYFIQHGEKPYLVIPFDSLVLYSDSTNIQFELMTNNKWKLNKNSNWYDVIPDSGFGNTHIEIKCLGNEDTLKRFDIPEFYSEQNSIKIKLIQKGREYYHILILADSLSCEKTEGSGKFTKNSVVTIKAIPNKGWNFLYWTENDSIISRESSFTFRLFSNRYFRANFEKISTDIKDEFFELSKYNLFQNYPNPFNPTTTISYTIPENKPENHSFQQKTTLKVFNVLGKEVATLVDKNQSPGCYQVIFNAKELPSGIYFYKITAGDFIQLRKMILLK